MLVIRNAQFSAIREGILREVEHQALAEWPEADRPAAEDLRRAMARAISYGLASRGQLLRFLALGRKLSLDFDVDPNREWAAEVLHDVELTAAVRISILEERAS